MCDHRLLVKDANTGLSNRRSVQIVSSDRTAKNHDKDALLHLNNIMPSLLTFTTKLNYFSQEARNEQKTKPICTAISAHVICFLSIVGRISMIRNTIDALCTEENFAFSALYSMISKDIDQEKKELDVKRNLFKFRICIKLRGCLYCWERRKKVV